MKLTTFQEQRDNPGWAVVVGLRLSGFQLPLRSGIISTASPTTVATIMCIASICASPCACCAQSFDRNPPPPLPLPCTASFFHQFVRTCENCILCIFTYLVSHASDIHHAEDLYIAAFWFCLWHWAVDSCWSSTLQPPTMGSNSCDVHHYVRAPLGRIFALDPDYGTVTPLGDRRWIAKDYCSSSASMDCVLLALCRFAP